MGRTIFFKCHLTEESKLVSAAVERAIKRYIKSWEQNEDLDRVAEAYARLEKKKKDMVTILALTQWRKTEKWKGKVRR